MVDEGHIFLDDMDITYKSEHSRAKMIGRVFQDPMKGTAPKKKRKYNFKKPHKSPPKHPH